ncbi:MAG TPA: dihydrofolate reductase family protein [Stackebrandtia sp.]|jgi:dihydrofolate reductase|uniref:dihydrofolate reductase family protein n=1 Tax=Stackebrandtia sp. TaxID=2023065 RepID=UPI002D723837|nr:dihydrofolate reductase family protein [Stackebrandtia sp.]HZE40816.1 dihydrofolate reductase family protein [Stackebrandtia sp.]
MVKVVSALAVSVDGFITGRDPGPGNGLGDGGVLFDWYSNGDVPSSAFDGFRLYEPSRRVFDGAAASIGAVVAGRNTFDDSEGFGGGSPHPSAPMVVVSHRAAPPSVGDRQRFVGSLAEGVAAARDLAGGKDVALMGGGVVTAALAAGVVDELLLHQVPVLLGAGRRFFQQLPAHISLTLTEAVPAPGVTHLRYRVDNSRKQS